MTARTFSGLAGFLAVVLVAGACGDDEVVDAGTPGGLPLEGRVFLSESVVEQGAERSLVNGTRIRLSFDNGHLGASAGCNSMSGPVRIEDGRMDVGGLVTTEIGCEPALHEQDEWLATVLASGPSVSLDGPRLRLEGDGTVIVLVDRRIADPDRPLAATTWELDALVDGDLVSSVPAGSGATLSFSDRAVTIAVEGCNSGEASIEIDGSRIVVGPPMLTRIACEGSPAEVEASVLAVLAGEIDYEVQAASLTLSHPSGRALVFRARE